MRLKLTNGFKVHTLVPLMVSSLRVTSLLLTTDYFFIMKLNPFAIAFTALSGLVIFTAVETPSISQSPTVQAIEHMADQVDGVADNIGTVIENTQFNTIVD